MEKESWVDKYAPEELDDISGHPTAIKNIRGWADKWEKGRSQDPIILHGPPGTGKTSTAEALSNEYDWPLVEINASSARTKDDIISMAQQMRSTAIGGGYQLFLLDEVDSIDGRSLQPLLKVLDQSPNPVICTANEKWKIPDSMKNRSKLHKFNLQKRSIKPVIRDIAEEEGVEITSRQLGQLATRNGMRDAINDLQSYAEYGDDTDWDDRQTEDSPFAVTERILRNKDYIGGDGMTPPDMVDFLDENLPGEFEGVELMRAFQALSEADKWNQKVNETQDYSNWKYSGTIAEEVSNHRVTEPWEGYMNIDYPSSRRQYTPGANSSNSKAVLYRELKGEGRMEYTASFNFHEFRNEVLPILKDLPDEEKKNLILAESLSSEAYGELGIAKAEYEGWAMSEVDEVGEEEDEEDNMSLMDF